MLIANRFMRFRSSAIFLLLAVTFCSESQNPALCGEGTPIISSLSPLNSCPSGNIPVDIIGENIYKATSVTFAGEDVEFTVINNNNIRAMAPPHPAGLIEVSITTCSGIVSYVGFQYEPDPVLSGESPVEGCSSGGTDVILSGSVLNNVTDVTFCGNPYTGLQCCVFRTNKCCFSSLFIHGHCGCSSCYILWDFDPFRGLHISLFTAS